MHMNHPPPQPSEIERQLRQCQNCVKAQDVENARLAIRKLREDGDRVEFYSPRMLVIYGRQHFNAKVKCHNCLVKECDGE